MTGTRLGLVSLLDAEQSGPLQSSSPRLEGNGWWPKQLNTLLEFTQADQNNRNPFPLAPGDWTTGVSVTALRAITNVFIYIGFHTLYMHSLGKSKLADQGV